MASNLLTLTFIISISLSPLFINPSIARHHHRHHHHDEEDQEEENPQQVKFTTEVLNKVCQKTQDYSFCWTTLSSQQQESEDVGQVAKFSVKSALSYAEETSKQIESLVEEEEEDGDEKDGYKSCSDSYDDIVSNLKRANQFLKTGEYRRVEEKAREAGEAVNDCKKYLTSADWSVQDRNNNLEKHCSIIAAISGILPESE